MPTRRLTIEGRSWILILGLAAALSSQAGAQQSNPGTPAATASPASSSVVPGASLAIQGDLSTTGTVVSSSRTELVINDSGGRRRDFALDPAASLGAALVPGDEVRVRYDPIDGGKVLAKDVQTLNITEKMSRDERHQEMYAVSLPPTPGPLAVGEASLAQASTPPEATTSEPASGAPGGIPSQNGTSTEMPATASELPLMAAAGVLALGAGLGLGLVIRRTVWRA